MSSRTRPIRIPTIPGSAEWRALRRTGIGASEIAVITGDSPYGSITDLYQDKLGYSADLVENDSMAAGHWLEDIIARWYAQQTGRKVRRLNALLRDRERPFMIATPDREVAGKRLLEVKVTSHPGDQWGTPGTDQVPDRFFEQVTWQAEVADVDVVDIAVFFTHTRRREIYTVGRDRTIVDELVAFGADFWRHVETRTPPEPVGRGVRALLRADEIEADPELTNLATVSLALRAEIAEAEAQQKQVDDLIRARLDDVGGARGDGFRIHHRYQKGSEHVGWQKVATAYRGLIEEHGLDLTLAQWEAALPGGLDQIERDLTSIKAGARPLLINTVRVKESTHAA